MKALLAWWRARCDEAYRVQLARALYGYAYRQIADAPTHAHVSELAKLANDLEWEAHTLCQRLSVRVLARLWTFRR